MMPFGAIPEMADTTGFARQLASSVLSPAGLQLLATIAAAVAAVASWRSNWAALRFRRADAQERLYDRVVANPVLKALEEVQSRVLGLLATGLLKLDAHCAANAPHSDVQVLVATLASDVQTALQVVKDTVDTIRQAWPDGDCGTALRERIEKLEDDLVLDIERLAMDQSRPDIRGVLVQGVAKVHTILIDCDPSLATLGASLTRKKQSLWKRLWKRGT